MHTWSCPSSSSSPLPPPPTSLCRFERASEREREETSDIHSSSIMIGSSKLVRGSGLCASVSSSSSTGRQQRLVCRAEAGEASAEERFRLNNLSPAPGSKREKKRIGRGYGAGQGGSAGKGMRGQNARSGGGTRPGFEGGQNPLYRRYGRFPGSQNTHKQTHTDRETQHHTN